MIASLSKSIPNTEAESQAEGLKGEPSGGCPRLRTEFFALLAYCLPIASFTTPSPPVAAAENPITRLTGLSPTRLLSLLGGFIVALVASDDEGVILCPFRRCTDGYCPLCGATRSAGKLVRGDVIGAWHRHPVLVMWAVQGAFFGALAVFARRQGRQHGLPMRHILMANFALLVGVWLLRMGLGDIPRPTTLSFFGF